MWLLKYYINNVKLERYNGNTEDLANELLSEPSFIEANLFGDNQSLYLSNKQKEFIDLCNEDNKKKDENHQYIDECMIVSERFLRQNNIDVNYKVRIRNYYSYNNDNIIYISSSRIVDLEVK